AVDRGGRLLTDVSPTRRRGLMTLLGPLVAGGGSVWVRRPDEDGWQRRYAAERATSQLRAPTVPGAPGQPARS
nr:hypothetical protein [Nocardioidaceae bacterium]